MIIALGRSKSGLDPTPCYVHPGHLIEQDGGVLLVAQNGADRLGDIGGRQCRGRDLVQERLEEVVIVAVDHRHLDGRPGQLARRFESAEAGADDNDALENGGLGPLHRPSGESETTSFLAD